MIFLIHLRFIFGKITLLNVSVDFLIEFKAC